MFRKILLEETSDSDSLLELIESNVENAFKIREQIKKFEAIPQSRSLIADTSEEPEEIIDEGMMDEDEEFELDDDTIACIEEYRMLNAGDMEGLLSILPPKDSYDFVPVIYRLLAESLKEMKEMTEIQVLEGMEPDTEFMENEKGKMAMLYELLEEEEKNEEPVESFNNIILAPNISGKIFVLDDIDHISLEYNDAIYKLVESIINGKFKSPKRFTRTNGIFHSFSGICEVRGFQIRVLFQRLNHNTYALFSIFIKKTTSNRGYLDYLESRTIEYSKVADKIKSLVENEEFMKMNDDNLQEFWNKLGKSVEAKAYQRGLKQ